MSKKVYVDLSQKDVQDIINAYEKDIEKFNKQKEILDKIKEYCSNIKNLYWVEDDKPRYVSKDILELLEEIDSETRK